MQDCIFCKIIKKEIPCEKIYEDKNFLAFFDIEPVSFVHTLIIPKKHIVWMKDADDFTISEIFKLTKKLMLAIEKGLKCDFAQVSIVGEDVPHFHIHLIPRYFNDNLPRFPTKKYKDGESSEVARKIIQKIV